MIDAHHHLWDPDAVEYPWMTGEAAALRRRFTADDLAPHLDAAGVERTVLVQAADSGADTAWMLEHAPASVAAIVAWVPLDRPPDAGAALERLAADGRVRGVRTLLDERPSGWILSAPVLETLRLLARSGLVLDYPALFPEHLADLPALADAVPDLAIVLDHLASPPVGDAAALPAWRRELADAAARPNVVAKVSGLATAAVDGWSPDALAPYVDHALATFGPARLLYGSDWPVCLLAASYEDVLAAARATTAPLSADERAAVFGGTAARVYAL